MTVVQYKKVSIYQADTLILNDVDFEVSEGEFVYIIGKVGSGKSSLLQTLYCELDIEREDAETAVVLDKNLLNIKRKDIPNLRKQMGIIFQDFQLLHDRTVFKNLQFVLKSTGWKNKKAIQERIEEVLSLVGMSDKINKMPHELSGGEQQRIAIARAVLNNPKLIVADEPTGNLDPETAADIIKLLKGFTENGTSVIMTTHNLPMLDKYPGTVYQCVETSMKNVTEEFTPKKSAQ